MLVSVVLPVYNCEKYIASAIISILNQTHTDFELIIVDDASTDTTVLKILDFDDHRIKLIENTLNSGISYSLNLAIKTSVAKYILRMDADDVSFPDRIEKLIDYMEKHPIVDVLGSQAVIINNENEIIGLRECITDPKPFSRYKFSWFIHPTVMCKRSWFVDNFYNSKFNGAEDYELWLRNHKKSTYKNLQTPLLFYRDLNSFKKKTYIERNQQLVGAIFSNFRVLSFYNWVIMISFALLKSLIVWFLPKVILDAIFGNKRNVNISIKAIHAYKDILSRSLIYVRNSGNNM